MGETEINKKETRETIAKINKNKSWFFDKINKIDIPLATLSQKKQERDKLKKNKIKVKMEKSQ